MSLQESIRSPRSGLSQLVIEKKELATQKETLSDELLSETITLQSLKQFKLRLECWLASLELMLEATNRLKFQADSLAEYSSGSMDADFLLDELVAKIHWLKEILSQVKLQITDTSVGRDKHMQVFLDVEERLGEIAEAIKEICGISEQ